MYVNQVDDLFDGILNKFNDFLTKENSFQKFNSDTNFVKFQNDILNTIKKFIESIPKKDIIDIIKNEYTNLFKKHPNIRIHICRITTIPKDLVAICEIFIYVNKDDKSPQQSVSIMTFNDDRKIKRIHTYTG